MDKKYKLLLFKNNLYEHQKFLCRNCPRLCSARDVYDTHLKHYLDVNDDQKTIFPIRGKNDSIQFNKLGLANPFLITFDLESMLRNPEQSYEILNEHKNVSYAFKVCVTDNDIYANIPDEIGELVDKLYLHRAKDDDANVGLKFLNEVHMVCDKLVHNIKKYKETNRNDI